MKERITTLKDAVNLTKFAFEDVNYDKDLLLQRQTTPELASDMIAKSIDLISKIEDWSFENIQSSLLELIKQNSWNTGQFFMVFRVAICSSPQTIDIIKYV